MINGIAAYLGAIDAIVTRKPIDIAADVADAEAKLRTITDDASLVTDSPKLPALTDDQKAAVKDTLSLLSSVLDEVGRVGDLRKFELSQDPQTFEDNLDKLKTINAELVRNLSGQILHERTLVTLQLAAIAGKPDDFRKPLVTRQLDLALEFAREGLHQSGYSELGTV